jgi:hypothetical protein
MSGRISRSNAERSTSFPYCCSHSRSSAFRSAFDALPACVHLRYQRLGTGLPTEMLGAKVTISARDHIDVIDRVINECALPLIPEELHERF